MINQSPLFKLNFKFLILFFSFVIYCNESTAQILPSFIGDNYGGTGSAALQPASIADSRLMFDVPAIAFQTQNSTSFKLVNNNFEAQNTDNYYYSNQEYKVSGMISFCPTSAVAVSFSFVNFKNISGINKDLVPLINTPNPSDSSFSNTTAVNKNYNYNQLSYIKSSLSYAKVLLKKKKNFIKAGINANLYSSNNAEYISANEIEYRTASTNTNALVKGMFDYGFYNNSSSSKLGLGIDFGVVYEYRSKIKMIGEINRNFNKYKWRVGASIIDLGFINFSKSDNSQNFTTSNNFISSPNLIQQINSSPSELNNGIKQNITNTTITKTVGKETFVMNTPASISLQFDYLIRYKLYAGFTSLTPLFINSDPSRVKYLMSNVLYVRYEDPRFGAAIPLTLSENNKISLGLNIRLFRNYLIAGTSNILSVFGKKSEAYDWNFYFMFRFSLSSNCDPDDGVATGDNWEIVGKKTKKSKKNKAPNVNYSKNDSTSNELDNRNIERRDTVRVESKSNNNPTKTTKEKELPKVDSKEVMVVEKVFTIYFNKGKWDISENYFKQLDSLASRLSKYKKLKITIEGYTDSDGETNYNIDLSNKRVTEVYNYFLSKMGQKKSEKQIQSYYYGEKNPLNTNSSDLEKSLNRRVDIQLLIPKKK